MSTYAELLAKCKEDLQTSGWFGCTYRDKIEGKYPSCLGLVTTKVALNERPISTNNPIQDRVAEDLDRLIAEAIGIDIENITPRDYFSEIVYWNDTPGRSKEQVLAVIDKAMKLPGAKEEVDWATSQLVEN